MRFEPGVAHGDSVLVAGPDGEQLPLLTPPGVRNVQRVLASVPAPVDTERAPKGTEANATLFLDIVPLGPVAAPDGMLRRLRRDHGDSNPDTS